MRTALLQLNVTDDPEENLPGTLDMVSEAAAGGARFVLTPEVTNCLSASRTRQREVLQLLAEGAANKEIARSLAISEHTVKYHVNGILGKLDAQSRTEAVVRATRAGLIFL